MTFAQQHFREQLARHFAQVLIGCDGEHLQHFVCLVGQTNLNGAKVGAHALAERCMSGAGLLRLFAHFGRQVGAKFAAGHHFIFDLVVGGNALSAFPAVNPLAIDPAGCGCRSRRPVEGDELDVSHGSL